MKHLKNGLFALILNFSFVLQAQITDPVVLGYFPSWSESWAGPNQGSKLRDVPSFVNYVFLSFAKPNLTYTAGSYDLAGTGIQVPYDGCTLKESVSALRDKGTKVILSVGGETYWGTQDAYNINYQAIKDLVDDMGFVGIDWDFEPNGSFTNIGSTENVQHFIDFFNNSRALMPRSEGYILACAPSGVGALGGQLNDDPNSPFKFANRNSITGETDANLYSATVPTNGISLFGFSATGHMIPVMAAVGDKIDLIAFQGYNAGASTNRSIMYDAFAYYAEQYNIAVVAGVHYPDEPWGPYYEYTETNVASLSHHIKNYNTNGVNRTDNPDGIMIWQLLLQSASHSAYSYMNVASQVLNGASEADAIQNASNFTASPYTGGSQGCTSAPTGGSGAMFCSVQEYDTTNTYPTPNTKVYYNCKIWENQWFANPNEVPGTNAVWAETSDCTEGSGCTTLSTTSFEANNAIRIHPNPVNDIIQIEGLNKSLNYNIYDLGGKKVLSGELNSTYKINIKQLKKGLYLLKLSNGIVKKLIKN